MQRVNSKKSLNSAPKPAPANKFTVSCASLAVLGKFVVNSRNPYLSHNQLREKNDAVQDPLPSARTDIRMRNQLCLQAQRKAQLHADWVEKHSTNVKRTTEEEKHYLKILVRSAILRQRTENSTHLSRVILSRNEGAAPVKKNSGASNTNKKTVSQTEAFDLDFVVKRLMEDIDIVYQAHGYGTTLQTFSQLNPWQL